MNELYHTDVLNYISMHATAYLYSLVSKYLLCNVCIISRSFSRLHLQYHNTRVESVYPTPKIFGAEFESSWRSGVRSFIFTSVGASRKSTCCQFNLFLESYL